MCVRIQCSALHLRVPVTQDPFHFFMLSTTTTTTTRAFSESSCDRKWFPTRHPRTQGQLTLNTRDHEYTLTCGNTMQRMKHSVSDVVDFFLPFNEENVLRQVMAIRTHKGLDVCRGRIREEWRSKRDAGSRIHERIESLLRSQLFDADHDPTPSEPIDAFTGAGEPPFSESEEPCSTPACSYDGPLSLTADRLVFEYLIPNYEFLTVECGLVTPERSMAGCIDAIAIHKKDWERFRSSSVHSTDESCVLPLNLFEWKTSVASLPLPSRTLEDDPPPPLFALDWEQVGDVHGTAKPARHMMRPCTIPPLQHLYNTKWSRYALQMSLYSYLLAQEGYLHHFVSSFLAARGIKSMRRQVSLQVRCDVFVIGPEVLPPSPPTSEGRGQGAVPRSIPNVTVRRFVPHEMLDPYLEKERGAMKAREHCSAHISPESRNVAQSSREGKENVWCLEAWKPGEVLRGEEHDQQGSESAMVAFRSLMEKVLDRFQSHHSQSMCPKGH